nr:hypothetical protein [Tanacetum cinerariifolium]
MNQFCKMNGILRQFSVARTLQQNRVAERRNRTLIEVVRTMPANSKLPTTFWAEAVNTACLTVNAAGTNEVNELPFDLNMPALEDVSILNFSNDDEDDDIVADKNNMDTTIQVSLIPTTRIHKDYPLEAIGTKWVFKNKKDERKIVIRYKARLVAEGHTKEEMSDNNKVFTPVARIEAIRLFLAYALCKDFAVYQMDVKSFFLYRKIKEEVYVCQPLGFEDSNFPRVYKVEKAIYGLHQAPKAWYETLSTYLLDNGFQRGKFDKTLFIKRHKGDSLLVQVYVDDSIFGSTRKELRNAFQRLMHNKFQMSSMGELTFFLGLQVKQKNDGIFISQDKYVAKILKKFRFIEVKNASKPMKTQKPLLKDEDGEKYQVNPKDSHLHAVKRIFRAILDRKSTTGGCQFLGCRLISWQCKKHTVVANSTTKSTAMAKTINGEAQIHDWVDGKEITITESSVRRDLLLADEEGVDCLPNSTIFENLTLMGSLDNVSGKLLMYPMFVQIFLDQHLRDFSAHKRINTAPSHTKRVFANMRRVGKDEVIHKQWSDRLVRAATTASSLEAVHDNGNIDKTQSKATPNESRSQWTNSGGSPRCQDTIGDTIAQTRFEIISKLSNDSLLARGNTLQSDEDRMKLNELMELCTNLQLRVLELEKIKTTQANEIDNLKRRARVDSSKDEQSLGEDASKQERKINDIEADKDITLVNDQDDAEMFDVNDLHGEEVFVEKKVTHKEANDKVQKVVEDTNTAKVIVDAAQVGTLF